MKFANEVSLMINLCTRSCRSGSSLSESRSGTFIRGLKLDRDLNRLVYNVSRLLVQNERENTEIIFENLTEKKDYSNFVNPGLVESYLAETAL